MGALGLAALELIGKLLAEGAVDLARVVIGRVVRIVGGTGSEAQRDLALRGYLEGMARDRSSAATTLTEKRKRNETKP